MIEKHFSISEIDQLYSNMKLVLAEMFFLIQLEFPKKKGIFEIFSCDFSISNQLNPKLLEIGTNPSLMIGI